MEGSNNKADIKDKKTTFFSTGSVAPCDINYPDKNCFNGKLQEIDSLYFSFKNFKKLSRQLKGKRFSICHLSIRSLNTNFDKLKEFLASSNGSFSVAIVTESWCNKTANKNSILERNAKLLCIAKKDKIG